MNSEGRTTTYLSIEWISTGFVRAIRWECVRYASTHRWKLLCSRRMRTTSSDTTNINKMKREERNSRFSCASAYDINADVCECVCPLACLRELSGALNKRVSSVVSPLSNVAYHATHNIRWVYLRFRLDILSILCSYTGMSITQPDDSVLFRQSSNW